MYSLNVKQFVNQYIQGGTKIRINKSFETVFEGTVDELLYTYDIEILDYIVITVDIEDKYICLDCAEV